MRDGDDLRRLSFRKGKNIQLPGFINDGAHIILAAVIHHIVAIIQRQKIDISFLFLFNKAYI